MKNLKEGDTVEVMFHTLTDHWSLKGIIEHIPVDVGDLWYIRSTVGELYAINPTNCIFWGIKK